VDRASRLLSLIEVATGKGAAGRDSLVTLEAFGGAVCPVKEPLGVLH